MFYLSKRIEVAFAHRLELDYESKCSRMHGHNAIVTVYCKTERLNNSGMVVDFKEISSKVKALLDHQCANDVVDFNPTAGFAGRFPTVTRCLFRNRKATRLST